MKEPCRLLNCPVHLTLPPSRSLPLQHSALFELSACVTRLQAIARGIVHTQDTVDPRCTQTGGLGFSVRAGTAVCSKDGQSSQGPPVRWAKFHHFSSIHQGA